MRPASREDVARWDERVAANPGGGQILQTRAWGEFKRRWGWRPEYWVDDGLDLSVLALRRRVLPLGDVVYLPKGPDVTDPAAVIRVATDSALRRGAFVVTVDPEIRVDDVDPGVFVRAGFVRVPDVQMNRATIIVDIARDDDALIASFKPKTRYNIRLAARKGVTVETVDATDANLDTMYSLMAATQDRAGFFLRQRAYFTQYWQLQAASGQGQLFFAMYEGQVLAGLYATFIGTRGWYKDGGSVKEHSELMAPHLLQWEVMRWLRDRGVRSYDLVSVPRPSEMSDTHPLHGLYRFKSGFSETVTEFTGTFDVPVRSAAYAAWRRGMNRVASAYSRRVRHDLFY